MNSESCKFKSASPEVGTSPSRSVECAPKAEHVAAASGSNDENFSPNENAACCAKTKSVSADFDSRFLSTSKGISLCPHDMASPLVATVADKTVSVKIKVSEMKVSETATNQSRLPSKLSGITSEPCDDIIASGWTMKCVPRKPGSQIHVDKYYFAPDGSMYRSRKEALRSLGLDEKDAVVSAKKIVSQGKNTPRRTYWPKTLRRSSKKFVTPSASVSNKSEECDPEVMTAILPSRDTEQPQKKRKKRGPGRPRKDSKPKLESDFNEAVAQTTTVYSAPCHLQHEGQGEGSNMVRPSLKDESVQSSTEKSSSTTTKLSHNATASSSVEHPASFELVPYDIIFSNADNEYDALWPSRPDEFFAAPKAVDDSKVIAPVANCHTPVQAKRLSFMPVHNVEAQTNYFSPNPSSLLSADDIAFLSDQQVNSTEIDYETPLKEQADTSLIEFSWKSSTSYMFESRQDLPRLDVDEFVSQI